MFITIVFKQFRCCESTKPIDAICATAYSAIYSIDLYTVCIILASRIKQILTIAIL